MRRCDPVQTVRTFLQEHDIRNASVTAALSGGADSVCLLYCLLQCRMAFGLEISALHIQHSLRGAESQRDEDFCRRLCTDWNVPLRVVTVDVAAMRKNGMSTEEAARECRYQAFAAHRTDWIATAHTASDNVETMLFRLVRGTGLKGLSGIPPRRERYLRPLLRVTREQVERCLHEQGIAYVTDSSNLTDDYTRNFLRHRVVPLLREQNPSLDRTAAETADVLRTEEDFLQQAARTAYTAARRPDGSLTGLSVLHPALQRRCIRFFLQEHGLPDRYTAVTAVQKLVQQGGRAELNRNGVWVCVSRDVLFVETVPAQQTTEVPLVIGKNSLFPGICVETAVILRTDTEKFSSVHKKFTDSVLDYDIIRGYARLHTRTPGLRMLPAGKTHHVSMKKWLNECVTPTERRWVHFLSDAQGLLWVEGLGAAAHAAVTAQTQRMLVLSVHRTNTDCT